MISSGERAGKLGPRPAGTRRKLLLCLCPRRLVPQVLMNEGDHHAALTDGGGDSFCGAVADVAAGEDAGTLVSRRYRSRSSLPGCRWPSRRAGEHVSVAVEAILRATGTGNTLCRLHR